MPQTLNRIYNGQIIGGLFSRQTDANQALQAFEKLNIPLQNLQLMRQLSKHHDPNLYAEILRDRGVEETEAKAYDKAICEGKTLVMVYNVADPTTVLEVFDHLGAHVGAFDN